MSRLPSPNPLHPCTLPEFAAFASGTHVRLDIRTSLSTPCYNGNSVTGMACNTAVGLVAKSSIRWCRTWQMYGVFQVFAGLLLPIHQHGCRHMEYNKHLSSFVFCCASRNHSNSSKNLTPCCQTCAGHRQAEWGLEAAVHCQQ